MRENERKVPFLFLLLLFLWSGHPLMAVHGQEEQKRVTIMGLGDSITEGSPDFSSYLYPLWEKLFTAGYTVDFIGPRESNCRIGTLRHCGFSGKPVEFLAEKTDSLYALYPADVVLLHAGHNHFTNENPVAGMIAAYRSIIRKIQAINPDAYILMAQVIPSGKLPKYAYIPDLNRAIADMVSDFSDHVRLVDQATGFDWQEYTVSDRVHPNQKGAEKMAAVWFTALKEVLPKPAVSFSPEIYPYKKLADGKPLTLHVFRPDDKGTPDRAAIVFFFGGGWQLGTPLQFYRECSYYASRGMVAVAVDYQIGYLHHSTPADSFADAKEAIHWLHAHSSDLGIAADRIVVAGGSAGGQLAAALGTIRDEVAPSYRPALSVLYYPVLDMASRGYDNLSPIGHVTAQTPPALILLGTADPIVPVKDAEQYRDQLLQYGIDCELHLFEGAGHPLFYYRKPLTDIYYEIRALTDAFLEQKGFLKREN